jgi:hypothetical protein
MTSKICSVSKNHHHDKIVEIVEIVASSSNGKSKEKNL